MSDYFLTVENLYFVTFWVAYIYNRFSLQKLLDKSTYKQVQQWHTFYRQSQNYLNHKKSTHTQSILKNFFLKRWTSKYCSAV